MTVGSFMTRRSMLVRATVVWFAASCGKWVALGATGVVQPQEDPGFLHLSQALTGHTDLDPLTAARLSVAFAQVAPDHQARFKPLLALWRAGMLPSDLLDAADREGLKLTALAIVAAWYTGTAGSGVHAVTVSYRDALMQRPIADVLWPPTYALGGPAWWTAPTPATVGTAGQTPR